MAKTYSNDFLENTPVGTIMYLIVHNRRHTKAWVNEVIYDGFSHSTYSYTWEEPKCSPCRMTDHLFTVYLNHDKKKISVRFKQYNAFCNIPNYINSRNVDVSSNLFYESDLYDAYLTTDKELLKEYIHKEGDVLDEVIKNMEIERKKLEEGYQELKAFKL